MLIVESSVLPTPDHHSFYQYIYRSSLSRYARVAIVYLALFFLRPMGHGSSHARSRSTQSRAMIKSSQNVHYIEQSNLWVGKAILSSIFLASHGPWLIACTEQEHAVARDDQIESECALYRTIKFVGGESQGMRARARMRIAHYRVMYNSAFFVCFWNRG